MKSALFALTTLVASLAIAAPSHGGYGYGCISQSDAELLVSRYAAVIAAQSSDLGGEFPTTKLQQTTLTPSLQDPVTTAKAIAAQGYTVSEVKDSTAMNK